jgi:hypothetical protein
MTSQGFATTEINRLRMGGAYRATTLAGRSTEGEYLGIEVAYDEWRMILRGATGIESIALDDVASVHAAA